MSVGAPSPVARACSPISSDRRVSNCWLRAAMRVQRGWAGRRSACREARVTAGSTTLLRGLGTAPCFPCAPSIGTTRPQHPDRRLAGKHRSNHPPAATQTHWAIWSHSGLTNFRLWITRAAGSVTAVDYASAFVEENRAFAELIRHADMSKQVPTCPGWSLEQLFRHVGRGDRWAAQIVKDKVDDFLDPRSVEGGKPPPDLGDAILWLEAGARRLVDAVEQSGVETPVWTFLGTRPANWWIRRRLHETAVHRADVAIAIGSDFTLDAHIAADGINEWLERVAIQAGRDGSALPLARDDTIHVHATDPGLGAAGEWTVGVDDGRITWSHEHGKATVALRGGATELLLVLLRRVSVADTEIEFFGDDAVWQQWLDRTPL